MPIIPNLVERWALRHNKAPGIMLDLLGANAFHSAALAIDLGVFEHIGAGEKNPAELARLTGCDPEGMRRLLEFLAAAGYVQKKGANYANTSLTNHWLLKSKPGNIANFIHMWNSLLTETWPENLEYALRNGSIRIHLHDWMSLKPGRWAIFNESMAAMAAGPAEEIATRVGLSPDARRFLDIGGNHGQYSAAFCRKNPQLVATIFDVPDALEYAIATNNPQFDIRAGDIRKDDPGSGYDAVLVSNLIHYFGPEECQAIIKRAAGALAPGGMIVISDQVGSSNNRPLVDAFLHMMSLHYFIMTGSNAYAPGAIVSWLEAAGCKVVRKIKLRSAPGQMLIIGERTG
ncbi:MAG: methyltransferase [Alphaproteobacteria bacterium]|nr:methyltransferase [Alphaproteobacteria bacterium]MBV9372335.1 methyltransferase [Alphaproteobacteria bacterium]MBV9899627.1 methyltransferase [Alphaproteobacteria bacterium]